VTAPVFGGVEAGGTKVVCAVGTGPDDIRAETVIPTAAPGDTLGAAVAFFGEYSRAHGPLAALGIAAFGPLDLDPASPTWGWVTTTPKPGWARTDLAGPFRRALGVPVAVDTDVNGAAVAEHRWGAGRGADPFAYLTVGTGIGGGAVVHGRPLHGLVHPEMGHLRVPHDVAADPFPGVCPYHADCFEGLASGVAIARRWGAPAEALPASHPAWDLQARYIALGLVAVIAILSPRRIAVGGGILRAAHLLPRVRRDVGAILAGYVEAPALGEGIDRYIVPPVLGERAGVLGALGLAADAVHLPKWSSSRPGPGLS
jgi:fructokinase